MGLKEKGKKGVLKVWDDIYDARLDDKPAPNLLDVYLKREESIYTNPEEFFERTYLTNSMRELVEEVTNS